jgi:hypothetical protein
VTVIAHAHQVMPGTSWWKACGTSAALRMGGVQMQLTSAASTQAWHADGVLLQALQLLWDHVSNADTDHVHPTILPRAWDVSVTGQVMLDPYCRAVVHASLPDGVQVRAGMVHCSTIAIAVSSACFTTAVLFIQLDTRL